MLHYKRIFVGSRCQNSCRFCPAQGREEAVEPARIEEALLAGAENVVFCGGEPLLRPDLPEMARLAARRGARRIKVRTNARALAGGGPLAALLEAGVYFYEVEVCGPDAETHDAVCGAPGAYEETLGGMGAVREVTALRGAEFRPYLECVVPVVKENLGLLEFTLLSLLPLEPERIHFELADPELGLTQAAAYLKGALVLAMFNKVWATTLGVPLCLMAGFEPHVREALPQAASGRKLKACNKCALREVCLGVDAAVVARQGERQVEGQLAPLPSSRHLEGLRLLRRPLKEVA